MVAASQLMPGMTVAIGDGVYQVENVTKVSAVSKSVPFVKVRVRSLDSGTVLEKSLKATQEVEEVRLEEHKLEFLYIEEDRCVCLDTQTLELVSVPQETVGSKLYYLKEGIDVRAVCYKNEAFTLELPQFLELMVSSINSADKSGKFEKGARVATLETGAQVEVPSFIDVGDVIKVDPRAAGELGEYIQRV